MNASPVAAEKLAEMTTQFLVRGQFRSGIPYGTGHINDTFAIECEDQGGRVRYILQRINRYVFHDVDGLMENISRVTTHLARRTTGPDPSRRTLTLVPTRSGAPYHRDRAGDCWRCYLFIEGARTYDVIERPDQAREAARAFGEFQKALIDLPGGRLRETIPHFHDTRWRFAALCRAIAADEYGRVGAARAEIALAMERESMADVLLGLQQDGELPERVTHNDTKLNNVMLDDLTGEGVCVIDLDTVMPGLALYDFGDMVRTATNSVAEDATDLSRVESRLEIFAALADGYLSAAEGFLTESECRHLVFAGRVMTFEVGIRFLSDFLSGDVYFKTKRASHNLERARNQFALLQSMEARAADMEAHVERCLAR